MDDRYRIITWIANRESQRIARKVIRDLQGMTKGMQSGEDSGLANLWDEICVQRQGSESVMWDLYYETMFDMIETRVRELDVEVLKAIWLQTDDGFSWEPDKDEPGKAEIEYSESDIVSYILDNHVLKIAADWKNRRIQRFIDRDGDW